MTRTHMRRTSIVASIAALAMVTLSGCINVTYSLNVNPDATLSGKVQLAISKQAAQLLGVTDANDLNEKMKSGQLGDESPTGAAKDCTASEDATNFILDCTFANAQASELNQDWTLTSDGDTGTFHAVLGDSSSDATAQIPGLDQLPGTDAGGYELTLTYPGPISSVTGDRAVKTGPNTVTVKGTLDQKLDVTVVGSLSGGSTSMLWIYLLLGVLALGAIAILVFVLRAGSRSSAADEQPALDAAAATPAIAAAQEAPIASPDGGEQQ